MADELDIEIIEDMVDTASFERGQEYENQGRVKDFRWARADTILEGTVLGNGGRSYRVNVMFSSGTGSVQPTVGVCSCPVHVNCKHVVAVLLAVRRDQLSGSAAGRAAVWEQVLSGLMPRQESITKPIALQLQVQPTADRGRMALRGRLLTLGAKKRWVRGSASWSSLTYGRVFADADPDQRRILTTLWALQGSVRGAYQGDAWLRLDTLPLRTLWSLLQEGTAHGLALVQDNDFHTPVLLEDGEARLLVDLRRDPAGLRLRPRIRLGAETIGFDQVGLLGDPAQAVAVWGPLVGDAARDVANDSFSLALLDHPVPRELRSLMTRTSGLDVPTEDAERFLDNFYPLLEKQVETVSTDESFTPPTTPRPVLSLNVTVLQEHQIAVGWEWLYRREDDPPGTGTPRPLHATDDHGPGRDAQAEAEILTALDLGRFFPLLEDGTGHPGGRRLAAQSQLAGIDTVEFVTQLLPELTDHPDVLVNIVGQQVAYREAEEEPTIEVSTSDLDGDRDWFGLHVIIKVEGEKIPFQHLFQALAVGAPFLILPSGVFFSLNRPELKQLWELIQEANALSDAHDDQLRISRYQADLWDELAELGVITTQAQAWKESVNSLRSGEVVDSVPQPVGLLANLRDYQRDGFHWLAFLQKHNLGGILADDMGLGKTLQALAMICHVQESASDEHAPFLVVAPTSVVSNWAHECTHFAPGLKVVVVTETSRRGKYDLGELVEGADVVLTSYALFRIDFESYDPLTWTGLILDEAQFVKNHQSKAYQCVRRLSTPFKLAVTGTPLENNLMELWSLFSITAPGLFGGPSQFGEFYRQPIERQGNAELLEQLRRRIRPLMLRRTKEQVATELPPKQEQVMELDLLPKHGKVYQTHLQRERKKVLGLLESLNDNRFEIFRSLTALRLLSLDASLYDKEYADIPSTKLEALTELLEDIVAEGHRTLIFSQFTGFLGKVRERLLEQGIAHAYLDGKTRDRGKVIDSFRNGDAPVFLISLKAGGFGLNLTEADYCILLDPWWNPAAEAQAIDRTHRIGQTKKVHVYRLVANDTIEEKVMELKASKVKLFDAVMGDAAVSGGGLSAADIRGLLS